MSRERAGHKELGEILLEADLINQKQLTEALGLQESFGERLASILVRKRMLTEKFAVTYLGRQLGVVPVDLSRAELDLDLLDLVSIDLCEQHHVFPVRVEAGRLLLAMANPKDQALVDRLEADTGARLTPLIALESSIKHAVAEARRALKAGSRTFRPDVFTRDQDEPPPPPSAGDPEAAVGASPSGAAETRPQPVVAAPTPQTLPRSETRTATNTEAPTVLVALRSTTTSLKDLPTLLRERGYEVVAGRDGREVLSLVRQTMPDVVVAEGILPDLDGYQACRKIKSDERFRAVPVILLAAPDLGWRFAADVREKFGADEVVDSRCEVADLLQRIHFHLDRSSPATPTDADDKVRKLLKAGVVALKKGNHQEAVTVLGDGLAIDPFNDLIHYYLGMAHEKLGRVFEAMHHFERAVHVNPDFYDAIVSLANLYQTQGFRRKAVDMWELALQATSDEQARERMKEHILAQL